MSNAIGTGKYKYVPDPLGMKRCRKCQEVLPVAQFRVNRTKPDGLSYWCKPCLSTHVTDHQRAQEKERSWRKFGLTPAEYQTLFERQSGVCAVCKQPETRIVRGTLCHLSVDHDHTTGAVRGLLCDQCNRGLGYFRDNTEALENAIVYLQSYQSSGARTDILTPEVLDCDQVS